MSKEYNELRRLVNNIYVAQDDDIQCDKATTLMMQSAEATLPDEISRKQFPALWSHFEVCADCVREYTMLVRLAQLEAAAQLPQLKQFPPPPSKDHGRKWATVKDTIAKTMTGFAAMPEWAFRQHKGVPQGTGFEPVIIELETEKAQIELIADMNTLNHENYDLICTVEILDAAWNVFLEGTPIQLQQGVDGPIIQEETLDELGELAFANLAAGEYTLRLSLGGREYAVTNINLPAPD